MIVYTKLISSSSRLLSVSTNVRGSVIGFRNDIKIPSMVMNLDKDSQQQVLNTDTSTSGPTKSNYQYGNVLNQYIGYNHSLVNVTSNLIGNRYYSSSINNSGDKDTLKQAIHQLNKQGGDVKELSQDEITKQSNQLKQLYNDVISDIDNTLSIENKDTTITDSNIEKRFYQSKFVMTWNLPTHFNEGLPNNDRLNNPNSKELKKVWDLLSIESLISNDMIREKYITTKLSLCIECPSLCYLAIPLVKDTADRVETNRLDPDTSFLRLFLSFQLASHLSLWNEMRVLGDMMINCYPQSMSLIHQESEMILEKLDYYSIYKLLNQPGIVNLQSKQYKSDDPVTPIQKQTFNLQSFRFRQSTLQCENVDKEIEMKCKQQFQSNMDNLKKIMGKTGENDYLQSNPASNEFFCIGECVKWVLAFEDLPTISHSGIMNMKDGKLDLFGYTTQKLQDGIETEISSEFHGDFDLIDNDTVIQFKGAHQRVIRNVENNQTFIYTMNTIIQFSK